jgi:nitrite reductase/ring-hydroxylating ferredoxin subunit
MSESVAPTGPRSPGITYQQLLDTDPYPVPDVLRLESPKFLGSADVSKDRYTSYDWHRREVEGLWKRVWQMACREEQIAEVGAHIIYELAELSYIVVRTAPDEIKAYVNACLHRGRQLKDHGGRCSEFRCPFHGFTWALDGQFVDACLVGLRARRRGRVRAARGAGRQMGWVRVHQPRPGRRIVGIVPG